MISLLVGMLECKIAQTSQNTVFHAGVDSAAAIHGRGVADPHPAGSSQWGPHVIDWFSYGDAIRGGGLILD